MCITNRGLRIYVTSNSLRRNVLNNRLARSGYHQHAFRGPIGVHFIPQYSNYVHYGVMVHLLEQHVCQKLQLPMSIACFKRPNHGKEAACKYLPGKGKVRKIFIKALSETSRFCLTDILSFYLYEIRQKFNMKVHQRSLLSLV